MNASIEQIWQLFMQDFPAYQGQALPESYHFCDNEKDANECAELVQQGIKRATSTSLWWFEKHNHPIPEVGNLYIITDWEGKAVSVIKVKAVNQVPFHQITEEYAAIEGEGDKSLAYWKKVHWDYYSREMQAFGEQPDENMIIICEEFEKVYPQ